MGLHLVGTALNKIGGGKQLTAAGMGKNRKKPLLLGSQVCALGSHAILTGASEERLGNILDHVAWSQQGRRGWKD